MPVRRVISQARTQRSWRKVSVTGRPTPVVPCCAQQDVWTYECSIWHTLGRSTKTVTRARHFHRKSTAGSAKGQCLWGFEGIAPMKLFVCEQVRTRANGPEYGRTGRGSGFACVRGCSVLSASETPELWARWGCCLGCWVVALLRSYCRCRRILLQSYCSGWSCDVAARRPRRCLSPVGHGQARRWSALSASTGNGRRRAPGICMSLVVGRGSKRLSQMPQMSRMGNFVFALMRGSASASSQNSRT